jgi:hypothetical protein
MGTKRIALDFEDDDMAILTSAQEIAPRKFGCRSTGATIRAILRDFVARHDLTREQEPK